MGEAVLKAMPDDTRLPQDDAPPIRSLRFQLGRDDIAAFENLPSEDAGWRRWVVLAFAALAGGMWAFAEEVFFGDDPSTLQHFAGLLGAIALAWGLGAWVLRLDKRRVIGRRALPQGETRVDIGDDRLAVTEDGRTQTYLFEQMQWPIVTETHVFTQIGRIDRVILPLRAFGNADDMRSFALWLEQRMEALDALQETNDVKSPS
jgi:hypothetical protein